MSNEKCVCMWWMKQAQETVKNSKAVGEIFHWENIIKG